ncbi:UvrB/UvrC motif-containing protein [Lacrimispora sp. NSJ-141]|uniref:UvrB/UvrC motif-containing protein n=1 Tax=Lientehia hominis TaxID=2897778 RepID=A0AAP2RH64_9FIRM|nr:UvrB/UvrC motif-containing protein [Lientehia hominis]MCD2491811.1 UvrB/UvrC motif-containing protein [Lientehia hominis]
MLCEKCKIREANIRYTEVIGGVKTEHNLCSHCAKEMDFGHYTAMFDTDYPIGKLLSDLFGLDAERGDSDEMDMDQVVCPTCNTAYSDFVKDSRFGCPDCYRVFDLLMSENIKKIQGNDTHTGKRPLYGHEATEDHEGTEKTEDIQNSIEILSSKLQEAIREEEYEMAAKYRDEIRELKERMNADA